VASRTIGVGGSEKLRRRVSEISDGFRLTPDLSAASEGAAPATPDSAAKKGSSCGKPIRANRAAKGPPPHESLVRAPYFTVPLSRGSALSDSDQTGDEPLIQPATVLSRPQSLEAKVFRDVSAEVLRQLVKIQVDAQLV
jgi:hypothetical protein